MPGVWWSVTITSTPFSKSSLSSAWFVIPQSTVRKRSEASEVLGNPLHQHPVPFLQPVGDEGVDVGAQGGEAPNQDGRAREPVGVVVPVDADPLPLAERLLQEGRRLPQALEGKEGEGGSRSSLRLKPRCQ